jgi:hypothetical protein
LRLTFTPCSSFLRICWFFSIVVFASIKCILNSLESISIWYQMIDGNRSLKFQGKWVPFWVTEPI